MGPQSRDLDVISNHMCSPKISPVRNTAFSTMKEDRANTQKFSNVSMFEDGLNCFYTPIFQGSTPRILAP